MKEKIQTYVQLYYGEVELNISVQDDLKKQDGRLKNFGHIQVSNGMIGAKDCFWDNPSFFFSVSFADFKKECGKELRNKGFDVEVTYKSIKKLIKRAKKLNLITL